MLDSLPTWELPLQPFVSCAVLMQTLQRKCLSVAISVRTMFVLPMIRSVNPSATLTRTEDNMKTEPFVPFTIEIESLAELSVLFQAEKLDKKPILTKTEYSRLSYKMFESIEEQYRRYVEKK
jgi:hypothetical protein